MDDDSVVAKLKAKIGKQVSFKYPGQGKRQGTLKDRVVDKSGATSDNPSVSFWNVVDLIEFIDDPRPWIRFAYYRQEGDKRLVWARNPLADDEESLCRLFAAAGERAWFRRLVSSDATRLDARRPA